jgi:hypothetical protein
VARAADHTAKEGRASPCASPEDSTKDRFGNVDQLRRLYADGYDGDVVRELRDPIAGLRDSMVDLRQAPALA